VERERSCFFARVVEIPCAGDYRNCNGCLLNHPKIKEVVMRSSTVFLGVLALAFAFALSAHAQGYGYGMGPGMMGGYGGGYGHGYGMGPGMMGGYGGGYGHGYGMGPGMMGYGYGPGYGRRPQSQACRSFFNETQGLRKDLMNKKFEYSEALQNPKTSEDALSNLENQIDDLEGKIQAKNTKGCWW
jgi:hypothetical protein